jgi:coenzyme A diphosphatase NUDT7
MVDPTDRDSIHTAQREAFEEIGLESHQYSVIGCLLPTCDSRLVVITPVVALLRSPKFLDFRLSVDEASDAFYVDLEQFLLANENYKSIEVGDDFVTHHFNIDKYNIWGVTAYELIIIATLIYQRTPQFPVYRHEQYLDLKQITKQQMDFFRFCVDLRYRSDKNKQKSRL